jgi:hypothetical protein
VVITLLNGATSLAIPSHQHCSIQDVDLQPQMSKTSVPILTHYHNMVNPPHNVTSHRNPHLLILSKLRLITISNSSSHPSLPTHAYNTQNPIHEIQRIPRRASFSAFINSPSKSKSRSSICATPLLLILVRTWSET